METIKGVLALVMAFIMSFGQHLSPYITIIKSGGIDNLFDEWAYTDEFTKDYCIEIKKDPSKDFVILNLADIQWSTIDPYIYDGEVTKTTIDKLIKEQKPDLITVVGDNASIGQAYIELIKFIESYEIPWAPIMGNHDGQGTFDREYWDALKLCEAEHCLFQFGPKDMGYGNYIINITENGKLIHTLYMMDTHSDTTEDDTFNGPGGYDNLWANQIEWYKWAVNGITRLEGKTVPSTVFVHIPFCEYDIAYKEAYDVEKGAYIGEYAETSFGTLQEDVCCPKNNNGFFTVMKELGSTKDVVVGHDHKNTASIVYDGIRLSYGLKTGYGSYHIDGVNGGTTITINSNGETTVAHHYIPVE